MRALILALSALVVALSVSIVLADPVRPPRGPVFEVGRLIPDAQAGERARYRDESGEGVEWRVEAAVPGLTDRPTQLRVRAIRLDASGRPIPGGDAAYDHVPARHGLFPLTAPQDPTGFDRLWVWERIQRRPLSWRGQQRVLWRVDLVDPALPPEEDHVVAWIDPDVPVFGIVRWHYRGRTYDLVEQAP